MIIYFLRNFNIELHKYVHFLFLRRYNFFVRLFKKLVEKKRNKLGRKTNKISK
jgi:hypothetical protein